MIIHPIEITTHDGVTRASAHVTVEAGRASFADDLWYELPGRYANVISPRMDGFAMPLLLLAMANGEDMRVRGAMSPRLLRGMAEFQRVFHSWFPSRFGIVDIRVEGDVAARPAPLMQRPQGVATAFSGGVDSSYTLWSHLSENESDPRYQVTHAVFVHGFDIPLEDDTTFVRASGIYVHALNALGVELIPVRANVRRFAGPVPWEILHGAALAGVALVLDGLLGRFYVPASFSYSDLRPWGSHPVSDPFMSTDTLETHHDGAVERNDKIAALADWSPTHAWLRVCWKNPSATENCCACYKCVLTMICLEIVNALGRYRTFPRPLSRGAIRGIMLPPVEFEYAERLIASAAAAGKQAIADDLRAALARSRGAARPAGPARLLAALRGNRGRA